jgi:hypothetical protein
MVQVKDILGNKLIKAPEKAEFNIKEPKKHKKN